MKYTGCLYSLSQVLETTGSHVAAVWGSSLPVTVTEVLTLSSDTAGEVTVSLGRNGWAWLVIWKYRAGGGSYPYLLSQIWHIGLSSALCTVLGRVVTLPAAWLCHQRAW